MGAKTGTARLREMYPNCRNDFIFNFKSVARTLKPNIQKNMKSASY